MVQSPCVHQCAQVGNAIAHSDGEAEASNDAHSYGSHERARNNLSWVLASLCEMQGRVDAGVHEAGRREASQEGDRVWPSRSVVERRPNSLRILFGGPRDTCDCHHSEGGNSQCNWYCQQMPGRVSSKMTHSQCCGSKESLSVRTGCTTASQC